MKILSRSSYPISRERNEVLLEIVKVRSHGFLVKRECPIRIASWANRILIATSLALAPGVLLLSLTLIF